MRLARHEELVERMKHAIYMNIPDASGLESERAARVALDALLEAAVRLGVGHWGSTPVTDRYTLVLKLEASDDA